MKNWQAIGSLAMCKDDWKVSWKKKHATHDYDAKHIRTNDTYAVYSYMGLPITLKEWQK